MSSIADVRTVPTTPAGQVSYDINDLKQRVGALERNLAAGVSGGGGGVAGGAVTGDITGTLLGPLTINPASTPQMTRVGIGGAVDATSPLKVYANAGADSASVNSAGQLVLTRAGSSGGMSIGADVNLYRSATGRLTLAGTTAAEYEVTSATGSRARTMYTDVASPSTEQWWIGKESTNSLRISRGTATTGNGSSLLNQYPIELGGSGAFANALGDVQIFNKVKIYASTNGIYGAVALDLSISNIDQNVAPVAGSLYYTQGLTRTPPQRLTVSIAGISNGANGARATVTYTSDDDIRNDLACSVGATFPTAIVGSHTIADIGSFQSNAHYTTVNEYSGGGDKYIEAYHYVGHTQVKRRGSLCSGGEWATFIYNNTTTDPQSTTAAGPFTNRGPARASGGFFGIFEGNTYGSYANNAIFDVGSPWQQTGARGVWAHSAGMERGGTGVWIGGGHSRFPPGDTRDWHRAIVVNVGSGPSFAGTDVFTVAGQGYVGLGVAEDNTGSVIPARLTFLTSTSKVDGIQFGTSSETNLYRSAAGEMTWLSNGGSQSITRYASPIVGTPQTSQVVALAFDDGVVPRWQVNKLSNNNFRFDNNNPTAFAAILITNYVSPLVTTTSAHGLTPGDTTVITGHSVIPDGTYTVGDLDATTPTTKFNIDAVTPPAGSASGGTGTSQRNVPFKQPLSFTAGGNITMTGKWANASVPTQVAAIDLGAAIAWDGRRALVRLSAAWTGGFSHGFNGRGLSDDDNPSDETQNGGVGIGPFTQREGVLVQAGGALGHNDRGTWVGVLSTAFGKPVLGTASMTGGSYVSGAVTVPNSANLATLVNGNTVVISGTTGVTGLNKAWLVTSVSIGVSNTTFNITGGPAGTATVTGATVRKVVYHETQAFLGNVTNDSYGASVRAGELDATSTVPAKLVGLSLNVGSDSAVYTDWNNAAIFGANSDHQQAGMMGINLSKIGTASNTGGTAIFINSSTVAPFKRALVVSQRASLSVATVDIFCVDGTTGYIGIGATTNQTSTVPSALTISPGTSTPATSDLGIQLGLTNPVYLFRSGSDAATMVGSFRPSGGIVSVNNITPSTGAIAAPKWPDIGSAGTNQTPTVGTWYVIVVEVPRNQTFNGAAFLIGGATPAAEKAIVCMWDANGSLVANSTTTPAANNIQTGAVAGPSALNGTNRWAQFPFVLTYAAKGPARYFLGVQFDTATVSLFRSTGTSFAGLGTTQAGTFGTTATLSSIPTTFNTASPYMYVY